MLNYVLSSLKTHSKRRKSGYIFNKILTENILNNHFLLNLKNLHSNSEKSSKIYTVFSSLLLICHLFFYSKVLIDDKTSINLVQIDVKFSMEIDPKIFNLQQKFHWLQAWVDFVAINM